MNTHSTTSNEGWIEWNGGECPVPPETIVEVESEDGYRASGYASGFLHSGGQGKNWWARNIDRVDALGRERRSPDDIIAYRIVEQGE